MRTGAPFFLFERRFDGPATESNCVHAGPFSFWGLRFSAFDTGAVHGGQSCLVFTFMKNSIFKGTGSFLILAIALVVTLSARADTNAYAGSRWSLLDTAKVLSAAAAITPTAFPDSDTAIVEQHSVRVYRADGTGEAQDETFSKVLTEKGRRASRTISLSYMLPYSTAEVVKLEVMKPGGAVEPVDVAANAKESIDESQMAMNIYDPNSKVVQVNLPKLEVGDVVHSVVRMTTQRAIIPGHFSEVNVLEGNGFIRHLTYDVFAPADRPLQKIALRDAIAGTVHYAAETNAAGAVTHHWEVANVPQMFDEPAMPPYEMVLQRLFVSTLPDWPAVSKWYAELSQPHLAALTPEMRQTVSNLIAGAQTDEEKMRAIFYHVSKKIRYMGLTPEKDRPGFEPHDVCVTFGKKYGVCRDKAALLVSLLREAGLKAYPVLINVGTWLDFEVASPDFNHAIVGVELAPGKYQLMDPTDENTRDFLPAQDGHHTFLVCRPEGEKLLVSPVQPPEENLMRVKTTGTLTAAGTLEARSELSFEGVNDDAYRNFFVTLKPDDLRRFFERDLKLVLPGAKLKSLKLTPENLLDMQANVRAEIEFSAAGLTANGNGKSLVTLPWIGKGLGMINFILRDAGLDKRKYPLQTGTTCGLEEELSLTLAGGFDRVVSLPECAPVADDCLTCRQQFVCTNNLLQATRSLKLQVVAFSPAQYTTLKQTLKGLDYDARKMPVLTLGKVDGEKKTVANVSATKPVQSDALVLESRKQLDVIDAHTAVYHVSYSKRILSYEGKKREAELKIEFNPATQAARLLRAVNIARTGERSEISPGEINVMDAGWNASAKRYTGAKTLVANLPNVDIGSTIEVEFEITETNRPFVAGFESFQLADELQGKSVTLTAPAGLKIAKRVSGLPGSVKESSERTGDRQTLRWTAEKVKAQPAEGQLPPEWVFGSSVNFFIGDVNSYYRELERTLLDRAGKSTQAAARARQLTGTAATRLDAVKSIRDYVVKSIRLAGPGFGELPLSELSAADTTLADGYGHLADRAILLHAMLTAAGFSPEFVLASELPPIAPITEVVKQFPLPQNFQYPLVRVVVAGETYYLNDTDEYAQLGTTPHANQLAWTLATRKLGEIQPAKNCRDHAETVYTLELANDGRAQIGITQHFYGNAFNQKKHYFAELPPEERRRYFQELVSSVAQGARPAGDLVTQFDTYPGVEQFRVNIDHFAVVDGNYFYFDLPFAPSLFPAGTDSRSLPLFISRGGRSVVCTEISLPPDFRKPVIVPTGKKLAAAGALSARVKTVAAAGKFSITHELETTPAIVAARDYPALLRTEAALREKSGRSFLWQKD